MKSLTKATTAIATSGTLFALQHHTQAAVIYSGLQNVSVSVDRSTVASRALGIGSFKLVLFRSTFRVHPSLQASSGGFLVNHTASRGLAKLAAGQVVSAGKAFSYGVPHGRLASNHGGGTWAQSQIGFAGVKFSDGTNSYFGWIRLEWTSSMDDVQSLTAIDWAYNDSPGASILTGQGIPSVPEPSRALLMLAGLGAMALRRKRKAQAAV